METASRYPGLELADSISYLARAHALLAGELAELSEDAPARNETAEEGRGS